MALAYLLFEIKGVMPSDYAKMTIQEKAILSAFVDEYIEKNKV